MPDVNKITVSGMVVSTWSYNGDLYTMVAIYDQAAPDEQSADVLDLLREQGVVDQQIDAVAAVLAQQRATPLPEQQAHYATVRFAHGLGPDEQPVSLTTGARIYVTGKYHEDRARQNLLAAARKCGIPTEQLPEKWRHMLQNANFIRPAPYIIPEGFVVLGRPSSKRAPRTRQAETSDT